MKGKSMDLKITCLNCESVLEGPAAGITQGAILTDVSPNEGDACICTTCGSIAVFTGNGTELRYPTFGEMIGLITQPDTRRAIQHIMDDIRRRKEAKLSEDFIEFLHDLKDALSSALRDAEGVGGSEVNDASSEKGWTTNPETGPTYEG
jgi:hypothetical protein